MIFQLLIFSSQDGMEVDGSDEDFEDAHDTFNDDDDIFEVGSVRRPEPLSKFTRVFQRLFYLTFHFITLVVNISLFCPFPRFEEFNESK